MNTRSGMPEIDQILPWPSWIAEEFGNEWTGCDLADEIRAVASAIVTGYSISGNEMPDIGVAIAADDDSYACALASPNGSEPQFAILLTRGFVEELKSCFDVVGRSRRKVHAFPKDRTAYAQYLFRLALAFFVECEISRILHGHVEYQQANYPSVRGSGVSTFPDGLDDDAELTLRTLVWDADCTAMSRQALWALNMVRSRGAARDEAGRRGSTATIWFDHFVAMNLAFRQLASLDLSHETGSKPQSPEFRLAGLPLVVATMCTEYGICDLGKFDFASGRNMSTLSKLAAGNEVPPSDVQIGALAREADCVVVELLNSDGHEAKPLDVGLLISGESERYADRWRELHPTLAPYAHGLLVGPDGHDPTPEERQILPPDNDGTQRLRNEVGRAQRSYNRTKYCLSPGCTGEVVGWSHTIPRAAQLASLSEEGCVAWMPFAPGEVLRDKPRAFHIGPDKKALAFQGFCAECDNKIFAGIDQIPESVTPRIAFLLAYRSFAYARWRLAVELQTAISHNPLDRARLPMQGTSFTYAWQLAASDLHATTFHHELETNSFGGLTTMVWDLGDAAGHGLRFSAMVPMNLDLRFRNIGVTFGDCVLPPSAFVHLLEVAGTVQLIVSWRNWVPSGVVDHFLESIEKAIRANRLADAFIKFAVISNNGLVMAPSWLANWDPKTRAALEKWYDQERRGVKKIAPMKALPKFEKWSVSDRSEQVSTSPAHLAEQAASLQAVLRHEHSHELAEHEAYWLRAVVRERSVQLAVRMNSGDEEGAMTSALEATRALALLGEEANELRIGVLSQIELLANKNGLDALAADVRARHNELRLSQPVPVCVPIVYDACALGAHAPDEACEVLRHAASSTSDPVDKTYILLALAEAQMAASEPMLAESTAEEVLRVSVPSSGSFDAFRAKSLDRAATILGMASTSNATRLRASGLVSEALALYRNLDQEAQAFFAPEIDNCQLFVLNIEAALPRRSRTSRISTAARAALRSKMSQRAAPPQPTYQFPIETQ